MIQEIQWRLVLKVLPFLILVLDSSHWLFMTCKHNNRRWSSCSQTHSSCSFNPTITARSGTPLRLSGLSNSRQPKSNRPSSPTSLSQSSTTQSQPTRASASSPTSRQSKTLRACSPRVTPSSSRTPCIWWRTQSCVPRPRLISVPSWARVWR